MDALVKSSCIKKHHSAPSLIGTTDAQLSDSKNRCVSLKATFLIYYILYAGIQRTYYKTAAEMYFVMVSSQMLE